MKRELYVLHCKINFSTSEQIPDVCIYGNRIAFAIDETETVRYCAYMWVCYPLVRSVSKPEALQRVSKRILICIANACPRFPPNCIPPNGARRLFFRGHVSQSLSSKSSNKAQDVVATYSQSNVRTISMWQTERRRLYTGCCDFTAPALQLRILWSIWSRFFLRNNVLSLVNLFNTIYIYTYDIKDAIVL